MNKTEELKRVMYASLTGFSKAFTIGNFTPPQFAELENALEAYLEALRKEHGDTLVQLDHTQHMQAVYSDAYDRQAVLTKNAYVFDREKWDELYNLRDEVKSVERDREDTYESLQEATAKLASQTQTIIALHRVVKDQQIAQASLQGLLKTNEAERNREQAEYHRQIMAVEKVCDERWELLESRQELIVSQRKAIETLTFELASVRKRNEKRSFWRFFGTKTHESKALPQK